MTKLKYSRKVVVLVFKTLHLHQPSFFPRIPVHKDGTQNARLAVQCDEYSIDLEGNKDLVCLYFWGLSVLCSNNGRIFSLHCVSLSFIKNLLRLK
jgi:hypothetical protein